MYSRGYDLGEADVAARVLPDDPPWTGEFECANAMVNRLQANISWGRRGLGRGLGLDEFRRNCRRASAPWPGDAVIAPALGLNHPDSP